MIDYAKLTKLFEEGKAIIERLQAENQALRTERMHLTEERDAARQRCPAAPNYCPHCGGRLKP